MIEELVYDGFHKIKRITAMLKGKEVFREKLILKDAVAALVIDADNKIALVSQYRPTAKKNTLELPAGLMDKPNLSKIEVLLEELQEECEIEKEDILKVSETPYHDYFMVAGSSDARISLYEIRVTKQFNKKVADVDVDEVIWVSLEEMKQLIDLGEIADSKTILTYYYAKSILQ